MRKIVVTGGAGFIGSHLAEELARRGYYVIILDDLSTGRRENLKASLGKKNVDFIQGSVMDLPLLEKLFKGIEYVFHQAAIPSIVRSTENPEASHEVNITGTLRVLLAARNNIARKVIYASSSSVYGDTPTLPKREDMSPNPQSTYAVTKLAGEYYCQAFQKTYGLHTTCLRYFNVYGPRQDPKSKYAAVIPRFISRVSKGLPPIIYGDGEQTRDFTFVKDVVEANILAAESELTGIFNIARNESISINQLANFVAGLLGKKLRPVYENPRAGDIRHSLADISKAQAFGWVPRWSLEAGLAETVRRLEYAT